MQKIYFVVVGKIKESFYREAVAEYVKRLSRFAKVEIKELPEGASQEQVASYEKLRKRRQNGKKTDYRQKADSCHLQLFQAFNIEF